MFKKRLRSDVTLDVTPQAGKTSDYDTVGLQLTDLTEDDQFDMGALTKQVELDYLREQSETALKKSEILFQQATSADAAQKNEIGNTRRVLARKLKVIADHFKKAHEAYEEKDEAKAFTFKEKVAKLQPSAKELQSHLDFLITEKKEMGRGGQCVTVH